MPASSRSSTTSAMSLNYLVDEISCFDRPPFGDLVPLDLDLLGQDVVSDLLTRFPYVGPLINNIIIKTFTLPNMHS